MDESPGRGLLTTLNAEVVECRRCARLVEWRERVAHEKRAAYADETYWGRPVPTFGDPQARLLVVGLAPAAHGANRTGRMFTGDRSGDWLYRALHKTGFANRSASVSASDDLRLNDALVTATVRCAPPDNKPLPAERDLCRPYLQRELDALLPHLSVVVALGGYAWGNLLAIFRDRALPIPRPRPPFAHGAELPLAGGPTLIASYHPSQQNTFTGKLTEEMFDKIWRRARDLLRD